MVKMFKYALNLVLRRKLRTFLTSLGIMIAVMLMTFILFGMTDLQTAIISQFSTQFKPTELYVSSQDMMFGGMMSAPTKEAEEEKEEVILNDDIKKKIEDLDGVKSMGEIFIINGVEMTLDGDGTAYPLTILEGSDLNGDHHVFKSLIGSDTVLNEGEMYVSDFVPSFYEISNEDIIGKTIKVKTASSSLLSIKTKSMLNKEYEFKIVGVVGTANDAFWIGREDSLKILSELGGFDNGEEYIKEAGYYQLIVDTDESKTTEVEKYMTDELGLSVISTETLIGFVSTLTGGLTIALFVFGGISALVASIGIINTMIMSIYEQTKEIGIIKAIGASNFQVLIIFLIQSAFIGFLGGVMGLGITYGIMRLADPFLVDVLNEQGFTVDVFFHFQVVNALYITFGSILIGVIAGIYPSMKAARLDPVKALHYE